jgi:hypothetical protein
VPASHPPEGPAYLYGAAALIWMDIGWISDSTRVLGLRYLAQVMHESIGLSTTKEIGGEHASYAPYYGGQQCLLRRQRDVR